jgi:DNA-binding transcriptional ArsR family regulator
MWNGLSTDEQDHLLKGTTLDVYRFLLKAGKPSGVREIQRALKLSSPSVAMYHLSKLEDAGIIKRESGNFVVNKVLLENSIRVSRFLVPRFVFYAIFVVAVLAVDLFLLKPPILTKTYFLPTIGLAGCAAAFCYEAYRTWRRGRL